MGKNEGTSLLSHQCLAHWHPSYLPCCITLANFKSHSSRNPIPSKEYTLDCEGSAPILYHMKGDCCFHEQTLFGKALKIYTKYYQMLDLSNIILEHTCAILLISCFDISTLRTPGAPPFLRHPAGKPELRGRRNPDPFWCSPSAKAEKSRDSPRSTVWVSPTPLP